MAVGIQETDGKSVVNSGAEYYWGVRAIDSGLTEDSKEETSAQLNLGKSLGQNPQDRQNKAGPEVPFFMGKDGKKKKKKKREVEVEPLEYHLKCSRSQKEEDLVAQKSFLLLCGIETVESQITTLTKLCTLLRHRLLQTRDEVIQTTPYRSIDSSTLLDKLTKSKREAILIMNPLLEETVKMCSDLTCRQFQSTIRQTSLVGWKDLIPTRDGSDHSIQSLVEVMEEDDGRRSGRNAHLKYMIRQRNRRRDAKTDFGLRGGQEDDWD